MKISIHDVEKNIQKMSHASILVNRKLFTFERVN